MCWGNFHWNAKICLLFPCWPWNDSLMWKALLNDSKRNQFYGQKKTVSSEAKNMLRTSNNPHFCNMDSVIFLMWTLDLRTHQMKWLFLGKRSSFASSVSPSVQKQKKKASKIIFCIGCAEHFLHYNCGPVLYDTCTFTCAWYTYEML